jgi:hypothetical protein
VTSSHRLHDKSPSGAGELVIASMGEFILEVAAGEVVIAAGEFIVVLGGLVAVAVEKLEFTGSPSDIHHKSETLYL